MKKFFKILIYSRKNDNYKLLRKSQGEKGEILEYFFIKEIPIKVSDAPVKVKRVIFSHIISQSQRADKPGKVDVKVIIENCLDEMRGGTILQSKLKEMIQLIHKKEEQIFKKLFTIHYVFKYTLLNRINNVNA